MQGSRSSKRAKTSTTPTRSSPNRVLASVSAAEFLQESVSSQNDGGFQAQLVDNVAQFGFFNGGNTTIEYNALLHNFGLVMPEQKQRIIDMLHFVETMGCESLRTSFRSIMSCMSKAMEVHRHLGEERGVMQAEINKLYALVEAGEVEKRKAQISLDEQLVSMDCRDVGFLYLRDDDDKIEEEMRALRNTVGRLEDANTSLNEELVRVDSDVDARVEERVGIIRASMRDFETECMEKAAQLDGARVEVESLSQKVSDLQSANSAKLSKMHALQMPGGLFFDRVSQTAVGCPIFLASGAVISMRSLVDLWTQAPSMFEGEVHRAVLYGGSNTFVAPKEQVEFMFNMAQAVGVDEEMPLCFEYTMPPGGEWTKFALHDQVALASKLCKISRRKLVDPEDFVVVGAAGAMKVVFLLVDTRLSFHVQSLVGDAVSVMGGRARLSAGWNPFVGLEIQ